MTLGTIRERIFWLLLIGVILVNATEGFIWGQRSFIWNALLTSLQIGVCIKIADDLGPYVMRWRTKR